MLRSSRLQGLQKIPGHLGGIVLSLLFLVVIHVYIYNFGAPLVTPTAYLLWLGAAAAIFLAVVQALASGVYVSPRLTAYAFLFIAALLVTTLVNPVLNGHNFIFQTAGLVGGVIFFIALHQFRFPEKTWERLLYVVFVSGAIEAGLGAIQYSGLPLKVSFLYLGALGGNFQQSNLLASYLATALVVSLYLLAGPAFRAFAVWGKAGFYALTMFISLALLLGTSRAGVLGALLGVGVLLAARWGSYRAARRPLGLWFLAVAIGLGGSLVAAKVYDRDPGIAATGHKMERLFGNLDGGATLDERLTLYRATYEMIEDRPFLGHGRSNFSGHYMFYQREFLKKNPGLPAVTSFTTYPHNELLYILAESGLVGGLGFVIVVVAIVALLFRLGRETGGAYAALLLPLALHTQTEFPFYQSVGHWLLFLTLLVLPSSRFVREQPLRLPGPWRAGFLLAAAAALFFTAWLLLGTLRAHVLFARYIGAGAPFIYMFPAVNNAYLGQTAERVLRVDTIQAMVIPREKRILKAPRAERVPDLAADERRLLEEFVAYSANERRASPLPAFYAWEARALYALGRANDAFDLLDEGQSLHPGEPRILRQARQQLIAMELKLRLSRHLSDRHRPDSEIPRRR